MIVMRAVVIGAEHSSEPPTCAALYKAQEFTFFRIASPPALHTDPSSIGQYEAADIDCICAGMAAAPRSAGHITTGVRARPGRGCGARARACAARACGAPWRVARGRGAAPPLLHAPAGDLDVPGVAAYDGQALSGEEEKQGTEDADK